MRLLLLLIFCISSLNTHVVYGQFKSNSQKKYKEAVEYYHKGNYAQAISLLAPLTQAQQKSSSISPYAHYYYALAKINQQKFQDGYLMVRQLIDRFPSWDKIDEANYLLALTLFEKKAPAEALKVLSKISNNSVKRKIPSLKQHHLHRINDSKTLNSLYQQFPDDQEVAFAMLTAINTAKSPTKEQVALAKQITSKFGKSTTSSANTQTTTNKDSDTKQVQKEHLNIAVLLPFRLDQTRSANHLKNTQYIIDYYSGLQLAQKQLAKEGIKVNLLPYDVINDTQQLENFYSNDKTNPSDLVIGPLYPKTYEEIVEYSKKSSAHVVSPFATDGNLIDKKGKVYLAHPSMQLQATEMAEFTTTLGGKLSVAVYYGNTTKDSSMAAQYVAHIKANKGEILELRKVGTNAEEINNAVSITEDKQPTYVALFSVSATTGPALMNILSGRKLGHLKVISVASAFNFQNNNAQYGQRLFIADPDFADLENPKIRQFQRTYFETTNTLPSVFSYQGYDQLLFFGRMIHRYQDKLEDGLDRHNNDKDYLLSGFDYSRGSRENKRFPILENHGGKWSQVN